MLCRYHSALDLRRRYDRAAQVMREAENFGWKELVGMRKTGIVGSPCGVLGYWRALQGGDSSIMLARTAFTGRSFLVANWGA